MPRGDRATLAPSAPQRHRRWRWWREMTQWFELEWMGGVAEHHYRKARPGVDDFAWDTLEPARYAPRMIDDTRLVWTSLAISEYSAIAAFSEVVSALTRVRAPLDLIGMTSDFLADEVRHVELASRMVMQLGGAVPRPFDPDKMTQVTDNDLTHQQRANELALRVGCIAEAFAGRTAARILRNTTHPLVRDVYISILRDEARHRRFGSLYFEWAGERMDAGERARLGRVALEALRRYAPLWSAPAANQEPATAELHELGWLERSRYVPMLIEVVRDELLPELRALGLTLPEAEVAALVEPRCPASL